MLSAELLTWQHSLVDMTMMGHSEKCRDLTTRWDRNKKECVPCQFKAGHEISPNCGYDDHGGRHELLFTACRPDTFNDGSQATCQPCSHCPPGKILESHCNSNTDTRCIYPRSQETTPVARKHRFSEASTLFHATDPPTTLMYPGVHSYLIWAVPLTIFISIMLVLLSICIIYMTRRRGQRTVLGYSRRASSIYEGFSPLSGNRDLENIISPEILSAPLQIVLDNLDVLEELVILLDPDNNRVKNTKHLASQWSFPSTWITYTYSMKDSKSPLKAVLEGVTSRHPDWTVGHLAQLLTQMERNDTIAVLAKLRLCSSPSL